jgi:hypothetical protein
MKIHNYLCTNCPPFLSLLVVFVCKRISMETYFFFNGNQVIFLVIIIPPFFSNDLIFFSYALITKF